jgi:hypothetical protein
LTELTPQSGVARVGIDGGGQRAGLLDGGGVLVWI